ncbi:MAG: hypothetical protein WDN28_26725 [Chthoniobacter sp.]
MNVPLREIFGEAPKTAREGRVRSPFPTASIRLRGKQLEQAPRFCGEAHFLFVGQQTAGADIRKFQKRGGAAHIVEGNTHGLIPFVDQGEDFQIALMRSLARIRGDLFDLAEHLFAVTIQRNRAEPFQCFPIRFWKIAGHD